MFINFNTSLESLKNLEYFYIILCNKRVFVMSIGAYIDKNGSVMRNILINDLGNNLILTLSLVTDLDGKMY